MRTMPAKYAFEPVIAGIWGNEDKNDENDVICYRAADFDYEHLKVNESAGVVRNIAPSELVVKTLHPGDILIEKSGGGEKTLVGRSVLFDSDKVAVCSNFVSVLRPKSGQSSRYWNYQLAALYSNRGTEPFIKQSTGIQNLDVKAYLSQHVPIRSFEEQERIADELDRELAEIDELIADQLRLLDLLQERLVSLTFDLATDASNPDRYETGHPFWKTLPKGWTLQKLGWHFKIGNGSTPLSTNESYWSDDSTQIPWFNSSTVNQDLAIRPARYVTELAVKDCHLPIVPKGSLLIGMIGQGKTRGKVTKTGIEATLSQNIAYLSPMNNSQVKVDFTKLALEASYTELREINSGNGTTKGSLSCENIQQFKIPIPPKGHQSEIIVLHTETYNEIQFLIAKLKKSRLLLNSKKFSIINSFLRIDN